MEAVIDHLGPNKVNVSFVVNDAYVQGSPFKPIDMNASFASIVNPLKLYESTRNKSHTTFRDSKPRATIEQQTTKFTPQPVQTSREFAPPTTSISNIVPEGNVIMYHMMCISSPAASLLVNPSDINRALDVFKSTIARELVSEKQLFKVYGFSKKRSITVEAMQSELQKAVTDGDMSTETLSCLAKYTKRNISIVQTSDKIRTDIVIDDMCEWSVFIQDAKGISYNGSITSKQQLDEYAISVVGNVNAVEKQKVNDLRALYKFITGNAKASMQKAELAKFLSDTLN